METVGRVLLYAAIIPAILMISISPFTIYGDDAHRQRRLRMVLAFATAILVVPGLRLSFIG